MQDVKIPSSQIIRDLVATCITRSLGYLNFFFSKCFEFTDEAMDTVVMKNIPATI